MNDWYPEYTENSNRLLRRRVEYWQDKAQATVAERDRLRQALANYVIVHDERQAEIMRGARMTPRPCACALCTAARAALGEQEAGDD